MFKYVAAFAATAATMMALDFLWLAVVARGIYQAGIGHLMAPQANLIAAAAFYAVFVTGLLVFAVVPHRSTPGWSRTLRAAAMLGFLTYATYDLTNLALLKDWPLGMSLVDMAWGVLLSMAAAAAGRKALISFSTD
jgi:uncharacterized membrane protein